MTTTSEVTLAAGSWTAIATGADQNVMIQASSEAQQVEFWFVAATSQPAASSVLGFRKKLSNMDLFTVEVATGENLYGRPLSNDAIKITVWDQA